jgi:PhzF family phenazine biosynthesis protein
LRRADTGGRLAFAAPPLRRTGALDEALLERIAAWLRVPRDAIVAHRRLDNGPGGVAVMLRSAAAVLALKPDFGAERDVELGVVGACPAGSETAFEVRAFFPVPDGIAEDPVTGSLNAALAMWLIDEGRAPPRYIASQGTAIGRRGRVHIERDGDTVWVGGDVALLVEGSVTL